MKNMIFKKQTGLTALLLMVLAANVSWNHLFQNSPMEFGETNLAQEAQPSGGSGESQPATGTTRPSTVGVPKPEVVVIPENCGKVSGSDTDFSCKRKICDADYVITFATVFKKQDGKEKEVTTITASKATASSGAIDFSMVRDGGALSVIQGSTLSTVADGVTKSVCSEDAKKKEAEAQALAAAKAKEEAEKKKKEEEEAKALAAKEAADKEKEKRAKWQRHFDCETNSEDEKLDEVGVAKCIVRRLDRIDREKDYDGKPFKRSKTQLNSLVASLDAKVHKQVLSMLKSKDDTIRENGASIAEDAEKALESLNDDDRIDTKKILKMSESYRAMRVGGKIYAEKGAELKEKARDLNERIRGNYLVRQREPSNPFAIREFNELMYEHQDLQRELTFGETARGLAQLEADRSRGYLTSREYNEFTNPLRNLQTSLSRMFDPNYITRSGSFDSDIGLYANDVFSIRGLGSPSQRTYGAVLPGRSSGFNLGLAGRSSNLNTLSISPIGGGSLLNRNYIAGQGINGTLLPNSMYNRNLPTMRTPMFNTMGSGMIRPGGVGGVGGRGVIGQPLNYR